MSNTASSNIKLSPPQGEKEQAEKYLQKLTGLINKDKLPVTHTDLKKFDLNSIQDHYSLDLEGYEVEVSHTKAPDSGQDFYIMLFNNVKRIQAENGSCNEKIILAYFHLSQDQFQNFKEAALGYIERKRQQEERKRFQENMAPIDQALENLESGLKENEETTISQESAPPARTYQDTLQPDLPFLSPESTTFPPLTS